MRSNGVSEDPRLAAYQAAADARRTAQGAPWAFATLVLFHVADIAQEFVMRCG